MTTNSIDVFVYSYKGKILKDVIRTLNENSSNLNSVNIAIVDQHPLDRRQSFKNEFDCVYSHVFWDYQTTPMLYKNRAINFSRSKYLLILSDNILMSKNWDEVLINQVNNTDSFISGNSKVELLNENLFYLKVNKENTDSFNITNFIDRSMIFAKTDAFKKISYPDYLKYNGEEEAMSLDIFTQGMDIYSAPTNLYNKMGKTAIEEHYVPFSINHNYNEVIDLLHNGQNSYVNFNNRTRSLQDFYQFHNFDFKKLNRLPFQTNDVEYSPENLNFNMVDSRKFVAKTKAIH